MFPPIFRKLFNFAKKHPHPTSDDDLLLRGDILPYGEEAPLKSAPEASTGTAETPARSDHVHPTPPEADKLTHERTITVTGFDFTGKAAFDGSKNVTIATTDTRTAGALELYVHKTGGADTNTGLSEDSPLASISKAMQIAEHRLLNNTGAIVKLYLDKGPWGDVTFGSLPFRVDIYPATKKAATEYADTLPHFTKLGVTYSNLYTFGVDAELVDATQNANLNMQGFARVGCLRARYGACVVVNAPVYEVGAEPAAAHKETSPDVSQCHPINIYKQGRVNFYMDTDGQKQMITLVENRTTGSCSFLALDDLGKFLVHAQAVVNSGEHTFAGKKYSIGRDCEVSTREDTGSFTWLDKLPGTQDGTVEEGATVNGAHVKADKSIGAKGNADTATKLKTARKITLTGDVTGTANFDGSDDASIETTGVQATKLKTARTITLKGETTGSISFDGSKNVDITTVCKPTTSIDYVATFEAALK